MVTNTKYTDFPSYGRLHNMRIELMPGPGCRVLDLVGDLHSATAMQAGETRLITAKLGFDKSEPSPPMRTTTSDNLMAELENDLGHTLTTYLYARLTYRHSGFPPLNNKLSEGLNSHVTNLTTQATAAIKRHNPQSAWSPRSSQTMEISPVTNPIIDLIETHLPADQARMALRRLANERAPIPLAKRFRNLGGSSEETIKPYNYIAKTMPAISGSPVQATSRAYDFGNQVKTTSSPLAATALAHTGREAQDEEIDPARKIWNEMRRYSQSKGARGRRHRASISADHYYSFADDCSPSRISSGEMSISSMDNIGGAVSDRMRSDFEQERSRIMDVALRNKRSVGADTLRSIVPSVVPNGEKKGGISGLGLGVGRSWGFGGSWW